MSSKIVLATVAFVLAGCAGRAAPLAIPPATGSALLAPATLNVAGTYTGSIKEVESGQTHTGTLTVTLKQAGTKVSGSFDISFPQGSLDLTLSGSIKKATKTKAKMTFTLYDASEKRYGDAKATVTGKGLKGKAIVPPSGTRKEIMATFKTKKKVPVYDL
jgi:predicted small lipoprotein YifL